MGGKITHRKRKWFVNTKLPTCPTCGIKMFKRFTMKEGQPRYLCPQCGQGSDAA